MNTTPRSLAYRAFCPLFAFILLWSAALPLTAEASKGRRSPGNNQCETDLGSGTRGSYVARVDQRIIRNTWDCTSCKKTGIPAVLTGDGTMTCPGCGSKRSEEEGEGFYNNKSRDHLNRVIGADEVTSKPEIIRAKAGADWECAFCPSSNAATSAQCENCGAPRAGTEARSATGTVNADGRAVTRNPRDASRTATITDSPTPAVPAPRVQAPTGSPNILRRALIGATAITGAAGVVGGIWWAMATHTVHGTVSRMQWQHTVDRQSYGVVRRHGWLADVQAMPAPVLPVNGRGERGGAFDVRPTGQEQSGIEEYIAGYHSEPYQVQNPREMDSCHAGRCELVDNGNGTSTENCPTICEPTYHTEYRQVPTMATRPTYAEACDYSTYQWQGQGIDAVTGGDSVSPSEYAAGHLAWPEVSTGPLDRLVTTESYQVTITYESGGKTHTEVVTVPAESEFLSWRAGDDVELDVRNIGSVAAVRRTGR